MKTNTCQVPCNTAVWRRQNQAVGSSPLLRASLHSPDYNIYTPLSLASGKIDGHKTSKKVNRQNGVSRAPGRWRRLRPPNWYITYGIYTAAGCPARSERERRKERDGWMSGENGQMAKAQNGTKASKQPLAEFISDTSPILLSFPSFSPPSVFYLPESAKSHHSTAGRTPEEETPAAGTGRTGVEPASVHR